jgi:hypothetical protein
VWTYAEPAAPNKRAVDLLVLWTGQDFQPRDKQAVRFIGTVPIQGLVWHVFELYELDDEGGPTFD